MDSIRKRLRSQQSINKSIEMKKTGWLPARSNGRKRVTRYACLGVLNEEDDDDDDIQVVDESEYLRRVAAVKANSIKQITSVEVKQNLGNDDNGCGNDHNVENECKIVHDDDSEEGKVIEKDDNGKHGNDHNVINECKAVHGDSKDGKVIEMDEIKVVDESEYLRRVAALKTNSIEQITSVQVKQNLGKDDNGKRDNDHDVRKECKVVHDDSEEGKVIEKDDNGKHDDDHDVRKECKAVHDDSEEGKAIEMDDIKVVDESEYLRRVVALKANSIEQFTSVEAEQNLDKDYHGKQGNDHDVKNECKVIHDDDSEEGKVIEKGDNGAHGNDQDVRKECKVVHDASEESKVIETDDIKVVDESEYLRRVVALKAESIKLITSVEVKQNLGKGDNGAHDNDQDVKKECKVVHDDSEESKVIEMDDNGKHDNNHDVKKKCKVVHDDSEEGKVIEMDDRNDESGADSLQIVGERWNHYDESHSSVTSSDSGSETMSVYRGVENEVGCSKETVEVACEQLSGVRSWSTGREKKKINQKNGRNGICSDANVYVGNSDGNRFMIKGGHNEKKRDRASRGGGFGKRMFDGLVLPEEPDNNALDDDFVGRRTRSHRQPGLPRMKRGDGTFSHPLAIDDESLSSSDSDKVDDVREGKNTPKPENTVSYENGSVRKRGRPRRNTYDKSRSDPKNDPKLENELEPQNDPNTKNEFKPKNDPKLQNEPETVDDKGYENAVKRKRGRPPKNSHVEKEFWRQTEKLRLKSNEAENILLNSILENGNLGLDTLESSKSKPLLPLKFSFGVQNSLPEKAKEEEEIGVLFDELDFALRVCDVGCSFSSSDENEEVKDVDIGSYYSAVVHEKLCRQGKHYLILDDEIGMRCKFCSFLKLEIKNVTPAFDNDPFGRSEKKKYPWLHYDEYLAAVSDGLQIPECQYKPEDFHLNNTQGTVWDLVPGIKKSLYPHQQEAFEFIWKNVGGTTELDELGKPTNFKIGGCIICHAPGTGKTRLAITFLQSFIKQYPMSKPVIISPRSMLLTWEEEFAKWNFNVPFYNLNKTELSGREDVGLLNCTNNARNTRKIRKLKLCSWSKGKGILGITYRLFEELAGERNDTDMSIKRALLDQPGILVLDEGHIPRNDDSNIWNVLTKVKTKRRIILSGTPFQNNFLELHNTLSLVREEFRNPCLLGGYVDDDRRIARLRKSMKPFVHVHKGEILKKMLRGLFHSVLFLKPSDLQMACCEKLSVDLKHIVELNHLISVVCAHPSLLSMCKQVPESIDKVLLQKYKENLEVGMKMKFLFELINLVVGEKILVFSQYLQPLKYITDLFKSRYNWTDGKDFLYMRGQQDTKERQSFINLFNDPNSEVKVLLASMKACGEGIHLIGASRVVLLDVVWNPSVERQAISRAYRIGQKKDVFVYHLILSETLEEKKYYRLVNKDRLSELVFSSEGEKRENMSILSRVSSEDRVLEEMIENQKTNSMFAKIIRESKADELIKSFIPGNP